MQGLSDRDLIDWGRDETTQPRQKNYLKDYITVELSSLISSGEKGKPQIEAFGIGPFLTAIQSVCMRLSFGLLHREGEGALHLTSLQVVVQQVTPYSTSTKLTKKKVIANLSLLKWGITLKAP